MKSVEDISDVDIAEYEDSSIVKISEVKKKKITSTKCRRTFFIEICHKLFVRKYSLQTHLKIHTGVKNF